jgi:hypothetical protein
MGDQVLDQEGVHAVYVLAQRLHGHLTNGIGRRAQGVDVRE